MARTAKVVLGVLTAWPPLYVVLFFAYVASAVLTASTEPDGLDAFRTLFAVHLATMVLVFALLAFYILDVFRNEAVPTSLKALWAVVLFFANVFAMPVYWYLYIWRQPATSEYAPPL